MTKHATKGRYDKRIWFVALGIFVAVFLFTFLTQKSKSDEAVEAASLANFDPGYIISDYQMGNYNSMTESEIQKFLTLKNPCNNNDYSLYKSLTSSYSNYSWHWANGHFACISEEKFGDGETIGSGDTAAHIIWQAAQDYKINPQVIIVLLQKEQSLITDDFPHSRQYRSATGYGCPDTAACSSKYYGFKNQVRNAAKLFRTVLDGGWTNYPLGNNYIQYNPNSSCGGSTVNIKSLATSALYRYTPYQPNAGALAAGYGTAYCGAYGNRNFYLFFEDWFGNIQSEGKLGVYGDMVVPRLFYVRAGAKYVRPGDNTVGVRAFSSFEYFTHLNHFEDRLCLSIGKNRNCYIYSDLEEIDIDETEVMARKRMLIVTSDTNYLDYKKKMFGSKVTKNSRIVFTKKINVDGQLCLQTDEDEREGRCIPYFKLQELPNSKIDNMAAPREIYVKKDVEVINLDNGISEKITGGERVYFTGRSSWFGELCLQRKSDIGTKKCILYSSLREIAEVDFSNMAVPRFMKIKNNAKVIDASTGENTKIIKDGKIAFFDEKINIDEGLCLQSNDKDLTSKNVCILYSDLEEVETFSKMAVPRDITLKSTAKYQELVSGKQSNISIKNNKMYFVDKTTLNGDLCLRTEADAKQNLYRCIKYSDLEE